MKQLLTLILLIPILALSQSEAEQPNRKISIGLSLSPDYSYRKLKPTIYYWGDTIHTAQTNANAEYVDSLNSIEKGKLATTFGISLTYKMSKHLSLHSGFFYSDKGIQSKGFLWMSTISGQVSISRKDKNVKQKFNFFEVPVSFSYAFDLDSSGNTQVHLIAGSTLCLNSGGHEFYSRKWDNGSANINDENSFGTSKVYPINILHIGYTVGAGISKKISNRVIITFEPVYKYYFSEFFTHRSKSYLNTIGNGMFIEKPYSFGCNLGLSIEI